MIAAIAFYAGWSLLHNGAYSRIADYVWAGLVIIQSFTIISYSPWFAFASMALAVLVIYALSSTSSWHDETTATAPPV